MSHIKNNPLVISFKPIESFLLLFGYSYNSNDNKCLLISNYLIQTMYLVLSVYLYINSLIVPSYPIFLNNILIRITNGVQLFVKILCFILLFTNNFSYKNHIQNVFRRLHSVDERFHKIKIEFNYNRNKSKLIIWILFLLIVTASLLGFTNVAFSSKLELKWSSLQVFVTPLLTPFLVNLQLILYTNICQQIKLRFDHVNALLSDNNSNTFDCELKKITIISKQHLELNECIRLVNSAWSYALLGIVGVPFSSITANVFLLFYFLAYTPETERIWQRAQLYCLMFWLLYHGVQILIAIIVCNATTLASQQTAILFNRFYSGHYQLEHKSDMDLIVLQLHNQTAQFTAYHFFNIDARLIFSMVSAITTYVVILLQFDAGSGLSEIFTIRGYEF